MDFNTFEELEKFIMSSVTEVFEKDVSKMSKDNLIFFQYCKIKYLRFVRRFKKNSKRHWEDTASRYKNFIDIAIGKELANPINQAYGGMILGDKAFIKNSLR